MSKAGCLLQVFSLLLEVSGHPACFKTPCRTLIASVPEVLGQNQAFYYKRNESPGHGSSSSNSSGSGSAAQHRELSCPAYTRHFGWLRVIRLVTESSAQTQVSAQVKGECPLRRSQKVIPFQLATFHVHALSTRTSVGSVVRALPEPSARQRCQQLSSPAGTEMSAGTVSSADQRTSLVAGMPEALDKRNSPAAGTGAGGINYSHGSAYDTGDNVKGYMGTQDVISSGQGYMTTPIGAGPGFGKNNEASAHNTGIGVSGAGTGSSGYHHGAGALITIAVACLAL